MRDIVQEMTTSGIRGTLLIRIGMVVCICRESGRRYLRPGTSGLTAETPEFLGRAYLSGQATGDADYRNGDLALLGIALDLHDDIPLESILCVWGIREMLSRMQGTEEEVNGFSKHASQTQDNSQ